MFGATTKLAAALIAIATRCLACTIFFPLVQVGPDFRVKVDNHGHAVQGLRVQITLNADPSKRQSALTGKDGFAQFRGVPPGSYSLRADHDAGIADGATLHVGLKGPNQVTVPLRWPGAHTVATRSLKGILIPPDYFLGPKPPPVANTQLALVEAVSGKLLKTSETRAAGDFTFGEIEPGFYFIEIKDSFTPDSSDKIAVKVDPTAATDHLELYLSFTSCGLMYTDLSQCPRGDLYLAEIHGRIIDPTGASIPRSDVALSDLMGQPIEQTRSDNAGAFVIRHSIPGTYKLVVRAAGFTGSRTTVHLDAIAEPHAKSPIEIQLGLAGSCSATYVH